MTNTTFKHVETGYALEVSDSVIMMASEKAYDDDNFSYIVEDQYFGTLIKGHGENDFDMSTAIRVGSDGVDDDSWVELRTPEIDAILHCIDPNVLSDIRRVDSYETMQEWPIDIDSLASHVFDGAVENAHYNSGVPDDLSDWDGPEQMCDVYLNGSADKLPEGMRLALYAKVDELVQKRSEMLAAERRSEEQSVSSFISRRVAEIKQKKAEPETPSKASRTPSQKYTF